MINNPTPAALAQELIKGREAGDFWYWGVSGTGQYVVEVGGQRDGRAYAGGRRREYDLAEMVAWLDGFRLGQVRAGQRRSGSWQLATALTDPLLSPGLADMLRLGIRAALEATGTTMTGLAKWIDRSRSGVRLALNLGGPHSALTLPAAGAMMAACGGTWMVRHAGQQSNTPRPTPADLRGGVEWPTLADKCRIQLAAAMRRAGINQAELANRIGRSRSNVQLALHIGGPPGKLTVPAAEAMMAVCGGRWLISYQIPRQLLVTSVQPTMEPMAARILRSLVLSHRAGLVTWRRPAIDINEAVQHIQRSGGITIARGRRELTVQPELLPAALLGVTDAVGHATTI